MKKLPLLRPKVVPSREPGKQALYKARWYARMAEIVIADVEIVIRGRGSRADTLFATSRALNVVEILDNVLHHLQYRDLHHAYYTCKGFQRVVDGSRGLQQSLFLTADLQARENVLPITILGLWPRAHILMRRLFIRQRIVDIHIHQLNRLLEKPSLKLLDRLISQPPLRSLKILTTIESPRPAKVGAMITITNDSGIRLGDLAYSIRDTVTKLKTGDYTYWTLRGELFSFEFVDNS